MNTPTLRNALVSVFVLFASQTVLDISVQAQEAELSSITTATVGSTNIALNIVVRPYAGADGLRMYFKTNLTQGWSPASSNWTGYNWVTNIYPFITNPNSTARFYQA